MDNYCIVENKRKDAINKYASSVQDKRIEAINRHYSGIENIKRMSAIKNKPAFCIFENLENEGKSNVKEKFGRKYYDYENSFRVSYMFEDGFIEKLPINKSRIDYLKNLYSIMLPYTCLILFRNKIDGQTFISNPIIC